jgi:acyl carrier protein
MAYSSVYDAVVTIIANQLDIDKDEINRESHLFNDLGADSLNVVNIKSEIEEEFDITIDEQDAQNLLLVGDIVDYLEENGATVGGSSGSNTGNSGDSGSGGSSGSSTGDSDDSGSGNNKDYHTIDITQYCPIYEDLLKSAFETGKFPNTTFSNTQSQVVGPDGSVSSGSPIMLTLTGDISGIPRCDFVALVQGNIARGMASSFTWSPSAWGNKTIVFHPGYTSVSDGMRRVDSSIFTTWIIQTGAISTTYYATCYFSVIDIDELNSVDNVNGIVTVAQPSISIAIHTPTCIFWGKTIYKGHNLIVPVAVVQWTSSGTSVSSRTILDWKSNMPY